MRRAYKKVRAGEWVYPVHRNYKMRCCDCGLVHTIDFGVLREPKRLSVKFRAFRDERATAAVRREDRKRK